MPEEAGYIPEIEEVEEQPVQTEKVEEPTEVPEGIEIIEEAPAEPAEVEEETKPETEVEEDLSIGIKDPKIKSRIGKLTAKFREAERESEEWKSAYAESQSYNQQAEAVVKEMGARMANVETLLRQEAAAAREAKLELAKLKLAAATETGDHAAAAQVQADMSALHNELAMVKGAAPVKPFVPVAPPQRRESGPTAATRDWVEKNTWVMDQSDPMSGFAKGLEAHFANKGFVVGSKACYDQIDAELRKRFPDRFGVATPTATQPAAKKTVPVATVTRTNTTSNGAATNSIRLTTAELADIKQSLGDMGIPITQRSIAEMHKVRLETRGRRN